jgi:FkbH-like protein
MWYCASIPYKKNFIIHLAANYSQYIMSLHGRKKCLVLDLDNVLWGGIIGEDGLDRIALGKDYPGNVYVDIQRLIKLFSQQGVILALNSKNNEADVKEVFQNHPEMVLKWDDFAAARVNWNPKPQNFVELAKEINIGLDSMVFVDDSPFETQMVNKLLPEVEIIQFGENPLENLQVIRETESFNFLSLTKEDLKKNEQYKAEARRKHLKKNIASIEEFYFTLEMKIKIHECDSFALTRAVQLIQKTNQFNLTTRRYSESDIEGFCNSDYHHIYTMSVSDKYGDFGIVGILITQVLKNDWLIDTFLLSCRIIGRDLETAFLSYVLEEARKYSAKRLIGKYIPTLKNKQVSDLYSKYAFTKVNGEFFLNTDKVILFPSWIELIKE